MGKVEMAMEEKLVMDHKETLIMHQIHCTVAKTPGLLLMLKKLKKDSNNLLIGQVS